MDQAGIEVEGWGVGESRWEVPFLSPLEQLTPSSAELLHLFSVTVEGLRLLNPQTPLLPSERAGSEHYLQSQALGGAAGVEMLTAGVSPP